MKLSIEEIKELLKSLLTEKRMIHVEGVVETSKELALKYGADIKKVELAAYLHDLAKFFSLEEMNELIDCEKTSKKYGNLPQLLHSFAGAEYAKKKLEITDEDILNAIRWHTVGRLDMSLVEKIVYLADAIEPGRNYPAVTKIRELSNESLEKAMLYEIDNKIKYLIDQGGTLHISTVELRNSLVTSNLSGGKSE